MFFQSGVTPEVTRQARMTEISLLGGTEGSGTETGVSLNPSELRGGSSPRMKEVGARKLEKEREQEKHITYQIT